MHIYRSTKIGAATGKGNRAGDQQLVRLRIIGNKNGCQEVTLRTIWCSYILINQELYFRQQVIFICVF